MTCTLSIDADILKHPVAYKYVVYSPKRKDDDCYEYLHGYSGNPNRCLIIPQTIHPGGMSVCIQMYVRVFMIGLSPRKPHTSVISLCPCACVCSLAWTDHILKILN